MRSWLTGILIVVMLGAVTAAAALAWYDGERLRAELEKTLAEEYGVTLDIGRLTRSYEFRPLVQIEGLSVSNARRSRETLIAVGHARFRVRLLSLLFGPLSLEDVEVRHARVAIPVDREGVRYWEPVVDAISTFLHRFDWSLEGFEIRDLTLDRQHIERGSELLVSARLAGDIHVADRSARRHVDVDLSLDGVRYPRDDENDADPAAPENHDAAEPSDDLYHGLLEFIERFDATIAIAVDGSSLYDTPLDGLRTLTTVNRGTFEFRVDRGRLLGGDLEGTFTVVRQAESAALALDASLRQADIALLLAGLPSLDGSAGTLDADIDLAAHGRRTPGVLSSAGGRFSLYMPGGRMPNEIAKWMAGDVFTAIFTDFEDTTMPVDCAVVEFDVAAGRATSRRMVLDTGSFTLTGAGRIDLPEARLAIELAPWSKRFRLLSMQLPVSIEGPFGDIRFDPDASEAVASLLTPIDPGRGADVACTAPDARLASR